MRFITILIRIDKENDRRINKEEFVACKKKMEKVMTTFKFRLSFSFCLNCPSCYQWVGPVEDPEAEFDSIGRRTNRTKSLLRH
jgi:hypothetical protein